MRVDQIHGFVGEELTYPITQEAVIDQIGTVEIEAPDQEDTDSIATIIASLGPETYDSADALYTTIIGNVSEKHIGRKYYDDRGHNPVPTPGTPHEERDISF